MWNLRKQDGVGMRSADGYNAVRTRKRRICNIIHNSTWLAESSILVACAVFQLLSVNVDSYLVMCFSDTLSALVFWRIISPFSHLFNEQRIKDIVINNGWISAMHHALKFHVDPRNGQRAAISNRANPIPPNNIEVLNRPIDKNARNKCSNAEADSNKTKIFLIESEGGETRETCFSNKNEAVLAHMEDIVLPNAVTE